VHKAGWTLCDQTDACHRKQLCPARNPTVVGARLWPGPALRPITRERPYAKLALALALAQRQGRRATTLGSNLRLLRELQGIASGRGCETPRVLRSQSDLPGARAVAGAPSPATKVDLNSFLVVRFDAGTRCESD
jgi:hypothetical protein